MNNLSDLDRIKMIENRIASYKSKELSEGFDKIARDKGIYLANPEPIIDLILANCSAIGTYEIPTIEMLLLYCLQPNCGSGQTGERYSECGILLGEYLIKSGANWNSYCPLGPGWVFFIESLIIKEWNYKDITQRYDYIIREALPGDRGMLTLVMAMCHLANGDTRMAQSEFNLIKRALCSRPDYNAVSTILGISKPYKTERICSKVIKKMAEQFRCQGHD